MLAFIVRRLIIAAVTLLTSTFLVYVLVANAGDPLEPLYSLVNVNEREAAIAARTQLLDLDQPVAQRYLTWLTGAAGCLVGACDLGNNVAGQDVAPLLGQAASSTIRLVTASAVLSIIIGVIIGVVSALRQYTGFDYVVTFFTFLFYSLPVFWVAVLLKEFGAIQVNNWLEEPRIPPLWIVGIAALSALTWQALLGGSWRRRASILVGSGVVTAAVLAWMSAVEWFARPALGPALVVLISVGWALGITFLTSGLGARRVLGAALIGAGTAVVGGIALDSALRDTSWAFIGLSFLVLIVVGLAAGWLLGGLDKPQAMRAGAYSALLGGLTVFTDHLLRSVPSYADSVNGRVMATIGEGTPNYSGTFWEVLLDQITALILPTTALIVISLALYTRFTRASMLEVLGMDYVRTARAKGLSERATTANHAFRNALIPVTTLAAINFGTLISGAVITETVFAWQGMGQLFVDGLRDVDPNPVMAFFLVTAVAVVLFNLLADVVYAYLDPRIRLT